MIKNLFFALTLIFFCSNVFSQDDSQWSGKFTIGGSYYKGNISKTDVRSDGAVSHIDSTFEFSTAYKTIYGRNETEENNREFSTVVKFDWKPYSVISPFLAFETYSNVYKGYDLRLSGLTGAKYSIYKSDKSAYSLSAAALYSIEKYTKPEDETDKVKDDSEIFRVSLRPKIEQKIGENVTFKHTTYYQPNVQQFSDYILETKTTLTNKLTDMLFLDLTFEYDYVSSPPSEDIEKEDIALIISLIVKFN